MLQTTADDLKLLSGELSKYHEPSVQVKTLPTPLDEEFNEKVHIEEVVNAKFYGNKIIDRTQASQIPRRDATDSILRLPSRNDMNNKKKTKYNSGPTSMPLLKKPVKKKLQMSRINTVEIKEKSSEEKQIEKPITLNNVEPRKCVPTQAVAYSEISHEYIKSNAKEVPQKSLKIQEMPTINIRSELRLQNVMKLDIIPESKDTSTKHLTQQNALVIEMQHEPPSKPKDIRPIKFDDSQYITLPTSNRLTTRKISKMTAYESSESNNVSSDTIHRSQKQTQGINSTHTIEKKASQNTKKNNTIAKKVTSRPQAHLEEWKRKLNTVYGRPASSKTSDRKKKIYPKSIIKKPASSDKIKENKEKNLKNQIKSGLNNTEYIPYSKLTLGGVNVSDIEREISNIPNKNNVVLSPILDKILSSRENSFNNDSPRKSSQVKSPKILTTSDENLLQEVLDIEMKVTKTLNNKNNDIKTTNEIKNNINDSTKDESYADDFEDDKTDASEQSKRSNSETSKSSHNIPSDFSTQDRSNNPDVDETSEKTNESNRSDNNNLTFTKAPTLSFKNKVDIFEFVHAIDTQDTGTQSNTSNKIIPKETQTSPRGDNSNVQPIHNDLWPSLDPKGEVEKMLKLEKEFIKKLIIEEYGDLLEKSLNKPSTSGNTEIKISEKNVAASQKITQTSPAHMKSVMTSPPRTKTRTTSPFALSVTVYQQTSPIIAEEELKIELGNEDDLAISANLSSPRFSLRLPQTSRDVLSNLEATVKNNKQASKYDKLRKHIFSSSSSVDGDYSSSDISSLGEINKKFKRLRKNRVPSLSEISTSSSQSKYSSDPSGPILPLRSEGEASVGRVNRKMTNKSSKSEGEVSLGQLR